MSHEEDFLHRALTAAAGDPRFNPVIAAAQAALESNYGRSQLAVQANNLKGVKAGSSWPGPVLELPTREWREADGTWYTTVARWRKYPNWQAAFRDYGGLIERVYPHAQEVAGDARAFLEALTSGALKYATDPDYTSKVWSIVKQYDLLNFRQPAEPSDRLLLLYNSDGSELDRYPVPLGADVFLRVSPDGRRFWLRFDERTE